jgi:hypothetical protein
MVYHAGLSRYLIITILAQGETVMYQRRPTGVTLIAALIIVFGAIGVISGLAVVATGDQLGFLSAIPGLQSLFNALTLIGIGIILVGGAQIAVGWGLLELKEWARIVALVLFALNAVLSLGGSISSFALVGFWGGTRPAIGVSTLLLVVLYGLIIWYLSKPDVAGAFAGETRHTIPDSDPPWPPVPDPIPSPPQPGPQPVPYVVKTQQMGGRPQPVGWLVCRSGSQAGKSFALEPGVQTIGRDPQKADILLEDLTVTGEHARIRYEGGRFYLYDLASTNHTYVNNRQIQKQMLRDGDVVGFGNAKFVFKSVS